jgi:DNA-binding CsgD family transcriptional regulator
LQATRVFRELDDMARGRLARRGIDPERSLRKWLGELVGADEEKVEQMLHEGLDNPLPCLPGEIALDVTPAEVLALKGIASGMTAEELAHANGISRHTAKDHMKSARRKLGARTAAHAVAIALVEGVIAPEDIAA